MSGQWQTRISSMYETHQDQNLAMQYPISSDTSEGNHFGMFSHHTSQDLSGASKRKRPKYTRSKNGCLTCRVKKVKCDEVHPVCTRCTQGNRECTWPNNSSAKLEHGKQQSTEDYMYSPSGLSDHSTPSSASSTREHSPNQTPECTAPAMASSQMQARAYSCTPTQFSSYSYSGHHPPLTSPVEYSHQAQTKWKYDYAAPIGVPAYDQNPVPTWQSSLLFHNGQPADSHYYPVTTDRARN